MVSRQGRVVVGVTNAIGMKWIMVKGTYCSNRIIVLACGCVSDVMTYSIVLDRTIGYVVIADIHSGKMD
jgi:hypothetical protein